MKILFQLASFVGLALVIYPVFAYVFGSMDKGAMSSLMLAGTILWFGSVPLWMGRGSASSKTD